MGNYELTERGKIIIAVVLVILLLVLPAVIIFGFSSCSDSSPPGGASSPSGPTRTPEDDDSLTISEAPLPDEGGGVTPPDIPGEPEPPEPTPEPSPDSLPIEGGDIIEGVDSPMYGPVSLNLNDGTMSFIFSPDEQENLDEDTMDMIVEFLSSPVKTSNSLVKVEMPHVSEDDEAAIISAVTQAFSQHNISRNGLVFAMSSIVVDERYFEISLSFTVPVSNSK